MRFISIRNLKQGMIVARSLYGAHGVLLLREGFALSIRHITALMRLGYPGAYVMDDSSFDIVAEEVIDEAKRATAMTIAKEMFEKSRTAKLEKNSDMFNSVAVLIDDIVTQVFSSNEAVLNIPLLKSFDEYTYQHSVDVGLLSVVVGRALELPRSIVLDLGKAAFLHDMGKMFIPKQILNKPGRLTNEEFDVIKKHPELGYDFAKSILRQPEHICRGVLSHHERFDGSGYPNRITGEKTPLFAKIISVVDVYDAISSRRAYKDAEVASEAYEFIMGNAGTHFCPEVARAFCSSVAPFPVGVTVELSDGRNAVVIKNNKHFMMRPVVRVIDRNNPKKHDNIDLARDINALDITIVSKRA